MSDGLAGLVGSLSGLVGPGGQGVLELMTSMTASAEGYKGKPAVGTGIQHIVKFTKKAGLLTDSTVSLIMPELPGIFGGFPQNKGTEIGPDALFIALFAIMLIANLGVFIKDASRKHYFYLLLGLASFCGLKIVGFATRIAWAHDITNIPLAICSVVFTQVAQLILLGLNFVLAHRVFTWHHPQIGSHWILTKLIDSLYFVVIGIIVLAILGQALPYLYFLSPYHYHICLNLEKAAAILNLVYSTLPFTFLILTYAFKPGSVVALPKMFNRFTNTKEPVMPAVYQATWVKSASLFYYPEKNAQWNAYKGDSLVDAMRIIPSREPPKMECTRINSHEKMHPYAPHLHWTTVTVIVSSFVLMMNTCFRVAACFNNKAYALPRKSGSGYSIQFWPHQPYAMFIFYGATEVCVLAFYLLMRIDLRFYIPDTIRKVPRDHEHNNAQNSDSESGEKNRLAYSERTTTNDTQDISKWESI